MYYEEQVINGVLCWRGTPDGEFKSMSANEITQRYVKLDVENQRLKEKMRWIPVSERYPEDKGDGELPEEDCNYEWDGNQGLLKAVRLLCLFEFDGSLMKDALWYNFIDDQWEWRDHEGKLIPIKAIAWQPLPEGKL